MPYFTKVKFLHFIFIASLFCACEKSRENTCNQEGKNDFTERNKSLCSPILITYQFGIEHLSPIQQIELLEKAGMDGIMLPINDIPQNSLPLYFKERSSFYVYDFYAFVDSQNSSSLQNQIDVIENAYQFIACNNTLMEVIFLGDKNNIISVVSRIGEIASKFNKELVIYPHDNTAIETAEEALVIIQEINTDNIYLSLHLCHELAAGNENRLNEIIKKVMPFTKTVSISGATLHEKADTTLPEWYWGIKPITDGTYDYSELYTELLKNNYEGPIAIHTYNLTQNFKVKIDEYLPLAKEVLLGKAKILCDSLMLE